MQEKNVRIIVWLGSHLVFFPLLLGLLHLYSFLLGRMETATGHALPSAWNDALTFLIFGVSYVSLAYAIAHRLEKHYPNSPRQVIRPPYG